MNSSEFRSKVIEYQRQLVKDALDKCTEKQQQFFIDRVYGKVDLIAEDKLVHAYALIQRTLKK